MDKVQKTNNSKYDLHIMCSFVVLLENSISKIMLYLLPVRGDNLFDFVVKQRFRIKFPVDKYGDITLQSTASASYQIQINSLQSCICLKLCYLQSRESVFK
jgi:hypothetical protein